MEKCFREILLIDPEPNIRRLWGGYLKRWGYDFDAAGDWEEAWRLLERCRYQIVITDFSGSSTDSIIPIRQIKRTYPLMEVIITAASSSSVEAAVEAMKIGVYEFLVKPINFRHAELILRNCSTHIQARQENLSLRQRNENLEALHEIKARFWAMANHELRRPVGMLLTAAEMLREKMQSQESDPMLALVEKSAWYLNDQLARFQEFEAIRAEISAMTLSEFALAPLWREVCEEFAAVLAQRSLRVHQDIPEHLSIMAGRDMFKKALRELFRNAVQFSENEGVLRARAHQNDSGGLEFHITDAGSGLTVDLQSRMHQHLPQDEDVLAYHAEAPAEDAGKSLGLGLGIIDEIIRAHHGEVQFSHSPGEGATYTLILPRHALHEQNSHKSNRNNASLGRG